MDLIGQVRDFSKEHLDPLRYWHTEHVVALALEIAGKEGADKEIVEIAAWFHDLGGSDPRGNKYNHHNYSVEIAEQFLEDLNYDPAKRSRVINCIKQHMGPWITFKEYLEKEGIGFDYMPRPCSLEAKCLYDADMIDLSGPVGITKRIIFRTHEGDINPEDMIKRLKEGSEKAFGDVQTGSGKEIGKKYFDIGQEFLQIL